MPIDSQEAHMCYVFNANEFHANALFATFLLLKIYILQEIFPCLFDAAYDYNTSKLQLCFPS